MISSGLPENAVKSPYQPPPGQLELARQLKRLQTPGVHPVDTAWKTNEPNDVCYRVVWWSCKVKRA